MLELAWGTGSKPDILEQKPMMTGRKQKPVVIGFCFDQYS
jgi:hypothetical protein